MNEVTLFLKNSHRRKKITTTLLLEKKYVTRLENKRQKLHVFLMLKENV